MVTDLPELDVALAAYRKRAQIETLFSGQKRRGFHIHKSCLSNPTRLRYLWLIYLGGCALRDAWLKRLHRPDRYDPSLFRLGLRLLARCLKKAIAIPYGLLVPAVLPRQLVRSWLPRVA